MKSCKCRWIHWTLAIIGALLLLCALISFIMIKPLLGVHHAFSFIHLANTMFLVALVSKLLCKGCCCNCTCTDETKEPEIK